MKSPHPAMKSSPRWPQPEEACVQQQRPATAKNKVNILKKEIKLQFAIHKFVSLYYEES